jgi:hypothetical protein
MIVKDEQRLLPLALQSAMPWVDEVVVVDTGSTDRTPEIARRMGARVFHDPWQGDFSLHRNRCLELACGEWILVLDADEELDQESAPLLARAMGDPEAEGYLLEVVNDLPGGAFSTRRAARLFRNLPHIRYQGRIQHWEIWNEPNNPRFWQPRRDPLQYTLLLKYAYQAAKAADPQAQVAGCAVVGDDVSFITDVLMAGGGDYLDIVSLHPYPQPKPLEWSQEAFNIQLLKDIMPQLGLNKPIWITETGYSTYSGALGVSPQRQAQLLARAYLTALALVCPFCNVMYEGQQKSIAKRLETKFKVPVVYITQVLGLALGFKPKELGFKLNRAKPKDLIKALKE